MKNSLNEEDVELFRQAVRHVTPIKTSAKRVDHRTQVPPDNIAKRRANAISAKSLSGSALSDYPYDPGSSEHSFFKTNGISSDVLRRLRRESRSIRASLDLHGLTIEQARETLAAFIVQCTAQGYRRVRIIHGQGFGSRTGSSVLRAHARHWLSQMPQVLGYVSPDAADGGEGAVLVLLRAS